MPQSLRWVFFGLVVAPIVVAASLFVYQNEVIPRTWNGCVASFHAFVQGYREPRDSSPAATNANADAAKVGANGYVTKADLDSLLAKQEEKRAEDVKRISEKLDSLQKTQAEANKK